VGRRGDLNKSPERKEIKLRVGVLPLCAMTGGTGQEEFGALHKNMVKNA